MFYAKIYREGEPSQFWSLIFTSEKVFYEAVEALENCKATRVSRYKYTWKWNRWILKHVGELSKFPEDLQEVCKDSETILHPVAVLQRIESIHRSWDSYL